MDNSNISKLENKKNKKSGLEDSSLEEVSMLNRKNTNELIKKISYIDCAINENDEDEIENDMEEDSININLNIMNFKLYLLKYSPEN
jgi:hypothetical protein